MSKDNNRRFLDIVFGGLIFSLFNSELNKSRENLDDWEGEYNLEKFRSFSEQVEKKRDGYKLQYNVDESVLKPKFINLVRIKEYLCSLETSYEKDENAIESLELEWSWKLRQRAINSIIEDNLHQGLIIINNEKPKYWVYSVEVELDHIKIVISDREEAGFNHLKEFRYLQDDFICLDLKEAENLAKVMQRFYHNFNERVMIVRDLNNQPKKLKMHDEILDLLEEIGTEKYNEIKIILEDKIFKNSLYLIYTLISLGNELNIDEYYKEAIVVFKNILKTEEDFLIEKGLESKIYKEILYAYIDLGSEEEIISLINTRYKKDYRFMDRIADELYDLELYKAAESAYRVLIENKKSVGDTWRILNAYKKIQDDEGIGAWRDELVRQGENTWIIDRYLKDQDPEGLKIKIEKLEREKNWERVIEYCNKYNKLILLHPWETMDKRVEYEFKKLEAYINLDKYNAAWNSICKTRNVLLSNFEKVDHFNYLSKAESYMKKICIHKNCFLDGLYHHIMESLYKDVLNYYSLDRELDFKLEKDLILQELLEKLDLKELGYRIENIIQDEYQNFSEKTIRRISGKLNDILEKSDYNFLLNEPKKYYPKLVARDFRVK
ncbi:hypothetical protein [Clostridium algidicarnis]|uniref:hypothetical protein n=1 Tax=Clostridium algidicarnis TaxID=37659 RepID=UPI00162615E1|nr:hypothetical protein [Clostridium algidicarnis]MBB6697276.1 hypothetical protein [Clostridium algidicarnis]